MHRLPLKKRFKSESYPQDGFIASGRAILRTGSHEGANPRQGRSQKLENRRDACRGGQAPSAEVRREDSETADERR
jgi:hypothetical protein